MAKALMKGNEALAEAAIRCGVTHFFGYPITPQNEIPEYLARELPKHGGVYLQAESEVAAIHMVYGAASAGGRVMTSSSSPGIALMQEGLSLLASARLPCVIINVQRAGPGIGGIQPSQSDYYQMTRGGGNGGYRIPSFAPATIQESVKKSSAPLKSWAVTGHRNIRSPVLIKTMSLIPEILQDHNLSLHDNYALIEENEASYESYHLDDAELIMISYGSTSRIVRDAITLLSKEGIKAGLIRPKTLWPFPIHPFQKIPSQCKALLCVEMSAGQMIDDVKLAVTADLPISFYGTTGGMIPTPIEIATHALELMGQEVVK